ncbi:MAG: transketolase, partial [Calditrichia bacterium]|nr:transketolase [Calditrichia bacterium]
LIFSDYMRPAIRLAALMGLPVKYVFTHDSIFLGEDGPTHQPIEHLASLRVIPNLTVIRPCDANETAEAWRFALQQTEGPVAIALTRQGLPILDRNEYASADGLHRGGYFLNKDESNKPDFILMSNGSEIHIALEAAIKLKEKNIFARVISIPSWELFDKQSEEYRNQVLPPEIENRIAIEAGATQGWQRYLGTKGYAIGLDHFGGSAPAGTLYEKFGITADNVVAKALHLLEC